MKCRAFLCAFLCLALLAGTAAAEALPAVDVGYYFDTVVTVTLYGPDDTLMADIWAACERYERMLSKTVPGSDVDRINTAAGAAVEVSAETWEILREAKEISAASGGAFSVTVAPLTALWSFTAGEERIPADEERLAALPLVDDSRIELLEGCRVRLPEGMSIDLGGIAKGYIADEVASLVRGRCTAALLNFGGNVYCVGYKPGGAVFNIGIRDPQADSSAVAKYVVSITDTSAVTSGNYERFFIRDGVRYHHILDPKTGLPAWTDLAGVTVICERSMVADAAATACMVLGSEDALAFLQAMGLEGLLITGEGESITTPDFVTHWNLRGI